MSIQLLETADSLEYLRDRQYQAFFDLLMTSTPYNIGIDYGVYEDSKEARAFLRWIQDHVQGWKQVVKKTGHFFLVAGGIPTNPWIPMRIATAVEECGIVLQNHIHWVKSWADEEEETHGHYKPTNSPRFVNDCHESVFHFTFDGKRPIDRLAVGVPFKDKSNLKRNTRGKNGDLHCAGNVWFIPYETIQNRDKDLPHPATFPVELVRRCLLLAGVKRGEINAVVDPMSGLGSTACACSDLMVPFHLGVDINPGYTKAAKERLKEHKVKQIQKAGDVPGQILIDGGVL